MGAKIGLVQNISGIQRLGQNWRWANGIRVEYFPGYNTLQLCDKVKSLLLRLDETPENFTGRIIFMSMFNDISWGSKDNENECESNAQLVSLYAKRFGKGQWSFLGLGSEKSGVLSVKIVHEEFGTMWLKGCCWNSQKAVQRSTQKRRRWKIFDTLLCRFGNDLNCFSHNYFCKSSQSLTEQSQKCVKNMKLFTIERGNPLSEGNRVPHSCQAWSRQKYFWIVMTVLTKIFCCNTMENELKSYHNKIKLSKFCMDAGFLNVVENGQYFMTKDTA